ncbi:MAG: glycosyltransferase, partial [Clostridia bacterium]|nr:glycosyltransferase [Clostridia bacterium]
KENGGVSSARNRALASAVGKYVAFVDSDDWVAADYLKNLLDAIKDDVDLVISGYKHCEKEIVSIESEDRTIHLNQDRLGVERMFYLPQINIPVSKLFLLDIIRENLIEFDTKIHVGEDKLFVLEYLNYCKKVRLLKRSDYYYNRLNQSSLTHKVHDDYSKWLFCCHNHIRELLEKFGTFDNSDLERMLGFNAFYSFNSASKTYAYLPKQDAEKAIIDALNLFRKDILPTERLLIKSGGPFVEMIVKLIVEGKDKQIPYEYIQYYKKRNRVKKFLRAVYMKIVSKSIEVRRDGLKDFH